METRLRGAYRDLEGLGHGRDRHPDVVMEHEDRPVIGPEPAEAALELITVRDERGRVAGRGIDDG